MLTYNSCPLYPPVLALRAAQPRRAIFCAYGALDVCVRSLTGVAPPQMLFSVCALCTAANGDRKEVNAWHALPNTLRVRVWVWVSPR